MVLPALPDGVRPVLTLYADGGTIGGSPGRGVYWSVASEDGLAVYGVDESGRRKHSDEAEMLALVSALTLTASHLQDGQVVLIWMDCRPLVRRLWALNGGSARVPRAPRARGLWWELVGRLDRLRERDIVVALCWVGRERLVEVLGH